MENNSLNLFAPIFQLEQNTNHQSKDKVVLSNLMLIHPSKCKSPPVWTRSKHFYNIKFLRPLLSLSLCLPFTQDISRLVAQPVDSTEFQTCLERVKIFISPMRQGCKQMHFSIRNYAKQYNYYSLIFN